jgi:hypothetical protein
MTMTTTTRLSLYEQIKNTMAQHVIGEEMTTGQIRDEVHARFGTNKDSVIPTDYCYNRDNHGINFEKHPKLFVYIDRGRLQYVGDNYICQGDVFAMPRGERFDRPVGKWERGKFIRNN